MGQLLEKSGIIAFSQRMNIYASSLSKILAQPFASVLSRKGTEVFFLLEDLTLPKIFIAASSIARE